MVRLPRRVLILRVSFQNAVAHFFQLTSLDHIFVFNLRAYDRLNKTPALVKQEEKSGVRYQDLQRAQAEEIMGTGLHGTKSEAGDKDAQVDDAGDEERERLTDAKRKFEAQRGEVGLEDPVMSADSIAEDAMMGGGKVSEEPWDGEPDAEKVNFVQEELYIHAKLCIVDDRIAICGSSNLNDRVSGTSSRTSGSMLTWKQSQMGIHDSELSIVMEDQNFLESTMDGQPFKAGHHAATLRRLLWREHLGLIPAQMLDAAKDPNAQPPDVPNDIMEGAEYEFVADPMSDKVWNLWTSQATKNTEIYRYLFRADPDNDIKTFADYNDFAPKNKIKQGHLFDPYMPAKEVRAKLDQIRGHLVWMPLDFMKDEEMAERGLQVNRYAVTT